MDLTGTQNEGRLKTRMHLSRRRWTPENIVLMGKHVPLLISDIRIVTAVTSDPHSSSPTSDGEDGDIMKILEQLKTGVFDTYCNFAVELGLDELCRHDFVHQVAFIGPSSDFAALMTDSMLGGSDSVAVTGDGYCHLRLTKNTFESLGLTGKPSIFDSRQFCCSVNLLEDCYKPGKKGYQRTIERLEAFSKGPDGKLPFITCAQKTKSDKLKQFNDTVTEHPINCQLKQIVSKCPLPEFGKHLLLPVNQESLANSISQDEWECYAYETLEWFGLVECEALQSLSESRQNPYISTYSPPMLEGRYADIYSLECNAGLLTLQCFKQVLERAGKILESHNELEWLYVHAKGHHGSPVSIAGKERSNGPSSDNDISFLLMKLPRHLKQPDSVAMDTLIEDIAVVAFRYVNEFDASL